MVRGEEIAPLRAVDIGLEHLKVIGGKNPVNGFPFLPVAKGVEGGFVGSVRVRPAIAVKKMRGEELIGFALFFWR